MDLKNAMIVSSVPYFNLNVIWVSSFIISHAFRPQTTKLAVKN